MNGNLPFGDLGSGSHSCHRQEKIEKTERVIPKKPNRYRNRFLTQNKANFMFYNIF